MKKSRRRIKFIILIFGRSLSMENAIFFIDQIEELRDYVKELLRKETINEILISGRFDNEVYQEIIDSVLLTDKINKLKIIIPMVGRKGVVSRSYINKICRTGGHMKINSKYRNNIVIIGEYTLIISFCSKHHHNSFNKLNFESCVVTNAKEVVEKITNKFNQIWKHSLALVEN
jgi:thymidine kinase